MVVLVGLFIFSLFILGVAGLIVALISLAFLFLSVKRKFRFLCELAWVLVCIKFSMNHPICFLVLLRYVRPAPDKNPPLKMQ